MNIPIPTSDQLKTALSLNSNLEFIATGGFKAVFKLVGSEHDNQALKAVYIPTANPDDGDALLNRQQLVARAKREISALKECTHPNIVKLGSIPPTDVSLSGNDYLVYSEEFLTGNSLNERLSASGSQFQFDELQELMWTLVDLIESLNELGYLHRDIKPANIMETPDANRRFVVLDLGIAYKMQGTELTRGGSPPGTLRYMAPELLSPDYKDNMDFRCDLYSAALTVYVLAAKLHPFAPNPEAPYATVYRIIKTNPLPLHQLRSDLPQSFCRIIDRCIRKKPALRYSNLRAVKTAIKQATK